MYVAYSFCNIVVLWPQVINMVHWISKLVKGWSLILDSQSGTSIGC